MAGELDEGFSPCVVVPVKLCISLLGDRFTFDGAPDALGRLRLEARGRRPSRSEARAAPP